MATQLFKNFPDIQYRLDSGKIITIKDFFRKSKIEQSAVNDIIDYEYLELMEGDRPDVVASKLYSDGDLHWTFFLVNNWNNYHIKHATERQRIYADQSFPYEIKKLKF